MTTRQMRVRPGRLMRCCLATLDDRAARTDPPRESDLLRCKHCGHWMMFRDGAWGWWEWVRHDPRRMKSPDEREN